VDRTTKRILDIGCGIGAFIPILHDRVPDASIIGLDLSTYLLGVLKSNHNSLPVCVIQGRMPEFPIQESSVDAIIAIQSLHEVFHFLGEEHLVMTLQKAHSILSKNGTFIALDHQNPGDDPVEAQIPESTMTKLNYFIERFQPRKIRYDVIDSDWIRISKRDLYDFITKIWSFGTPLEDEEMHETHTSFTRKEIQTNFEQTGFVVEHLETINPVKSRFKSFKVKVQNGTDLPGRHFLLRARKLQPS
jgi:ubiquinone/menaquinone biosynthesis C-methylase UbiE